MRAEELIARTKQFALRCIRLSRSLPREDVAYVVGKQLIRSSTSVGANYRAACRARSQADFASKIRVVEEEADECQYWLELIVEAKLIEESKVKELMKEAKEVTAIFSASGKTARKNRYNTSSTKRAEKS